MTNQVVRRFRELDQRVASGVRVTLTWDRVEDRVLLRVQDLAAGGTVEVEAHPGTARFAYEHPFAYLASVKHPAATGQDWCRISVA